jgi:hypothetical protein
MVELNSHQCHALMDLYDQCCWFATHWERYVSEHAGASEGETAAVETLAASVSRAHDSEMKTLVELVDTAKRKGVPEDRIMDLIHAELPQPLIKPFACKRAELQPTTA